MAKIENKFAALAASLAAGLGAIAQGEGMLLHAIVNARHDNGGRVLAWGDASDSVSLHYAINARLSEMEAACVITGSTASVYKSALKGALSELPMAALEAAVVVSWREVVRAVTAHRAEEREATGEKKKGRPASKKKEEKAAPAVSPTDSLPAFLVAFRTLRAAAPKVTANGEAFTLMDQVLALLTREQQMADKAKASKV